MSITQALRNQLKVIATSVDTNINSLLNMATVDQLEAIVEQHKHIQWIDPTNDERDNKLIGLSKQPLYGQWVVVFKNSINWEAQYFLHDLEIQDVLSLLQTVENNVTPCEV